MTLKFDSQQGLDEANDSLPLDAQSLGETLGIDPSLVSDSIWKTALLDPVRYAAQGGGKRFRARLTTLSWELGGGLAGACPRELPELIELIHSGSLIIDDIEDSSDTRRGRPSLHVQTGVPTALNAGSWLYFWPLFRMLSASRRGEVLQQRAVQTLMRAHCGQALDVHVTGPDVATNEIHGLVLATTTLKTGALMELAAFSGASASGAEDSTVNAIAVFGQQLGIGLQMLDDLSGFRTARKRQKVIEDLVNHRLTWPWAWLSKTVSEVEFAGFRKTWAQLNANRKPQADALIDELAEGLGEYGQSQVSTHLASAFSTLAETNVNPGALGELRREINRLENSYG